MKSFKRFIPQVSLKHLPEAAFNQDGSGTPQGKINRKNQRQKTSTNFKNNPNMTSTDG